MWPAPIGQQSWPQEFDVNATQMGTQKDSKCIKRNRKVYLAHQAESDDAVRVVAVGGLAGLLRHVVAEAPPRGVSVLALRVEALSKGPFSMAKV